MAPRPSGNPGRRDHPRRFNKTDAVVLRSTQQQNYSVVTTAPPKGKKSRRRQSRSGRTYPKEWPAAGLCEVDSCGQEAGCINNLENNTHYCNCPHDGSPPTADFKCPNRSIVPIKPRPIHNIIPPSDANNETASELPKEHNFTSGILISSIVGIVLFFCILLSCWKLCRIRSRHFKNDNKNQRTPMSLRKGLLEADRYKNNPQYFISDTTSVLSVPCIPCESISFGPSIGEGCFGKVYKGELGTESGIIIVAVKVLKDSATREIEEDFMREVEIMSSFQHANILTLLGISVKEPSKCPWMIFEFMPYGDLTDVLRSNNKSLRNNEVPPLVLTKESLLYIALQIANGMHYLATQHFVHRDLACRNCLVGESLTVKIADFGMSRDVYTCDYYKVGGSRLLPVRWMSPESITYGRFTLESDVWSYGVVLWEIFTYGKQPYFGHSNEEVVRLILQGIMLTPAEDCPSAVCELMRSCWKTEPRDRTNFSEVVRRLETLVSQRTPLPLPPPLSAVPLCLPSPEELDSDMYLKPNPPSPPHQYLQPLPD